MLITVMSEGELHVPRLGRLAAAPGFRLVAAMNPFDNIGTSRVASAIYDRICRITMDYQSASDEESIVEQRTGAGDEVLRRRAVVVTRATRDHPDIRVGSSVRGAIDLVDIQKMGHLPASMSLAARSSRAKASAISSSLMVKGGRIRTTFWPPGTVRTCRA